MKKGQRLWTRNELLLALNLYYKTPFGKLDQNNPDIIHLAKLIGRTPSAVAYKLVNFASLDPAQQARGITGAPNTSKLDKDIWKEYFDNLNDLVFESERLLSDYEGKSIEELHEIDIKDLPEGKMKEKKLRVRVNQNFFRRSVLTSYKNTCCITGINQPELLIAGHIIPWSEDKKNRMNPRNGISINALHDKAFEQGLITITIEYKVKISSIFYIQKKSGWLENYFLRYDNSPILLPERFLPDIEFLKYHNENKFMH